MPRADRAAVALLQQIGGSTPPISVEKLADAIEAEIVYDRLDDDLSGLAIREGARRIVGVNKRHARTRQRFTIAHEIGHLVLHPGKPVIVDGWLVSFRDPVSGTATDLEEIQANAFAATVLMPRGLVLSEARILASEPALSERQFVSRLANTFDVSIEAMNYRLANLGVLR